eukprot:Gregarina_sp_Pseudo_9__335@NODE_1216_length_1770_cov_36_108030_g1142_i0_p1_GENE_NODE_1216_length_1770_cov_36_108030_g1142_i0NODE_1216_length_1770_cov_36_108030_g1142_i0_p1_ORF_typecomplete_len355_score18_30DNA_pol3_delta2/PF13177_6/2_2e27DNA_pol3_delta2/PF13177_6/1_7e02Rad17/PF03215_15/1e09RuvB_N/PF05496_12/0_0011AAA_30/PF13604_6/0_00015Rep_fac_C/PF08542_11/0_0027AAA_22/PF13401_6/0_039AAA_22/PF13401_6/2_6e03AAA/PF00004_29/0_027Flavi_DEAD/PF07652_14/0_12DUF815/PF05673_13/0_07Sigma54_activ_2/PF145
MTVLWLDAYCPQSLDDCDCHPQVQKELRRMAESREIPHLILHGPAGGGKQTRVRNLLKAVFGEGAGKLKSESITVENSGFVFETIQSQYHTEVYASDLGFKDKQCVQLVIKSLASTYNANTLMSVNKDKDVPKYRVFVIQEAHTLSMPAQAALRRTMECYSNSARIILLTEKLSGLIDPLRSRCFCLRVPLPQVQEVVGVLRAVSSKALTQSPDNAFLTAVASAANRNLRVALLVMQRSMKSGKPSSANLDKFQARWRIVVAEVCDKVRASQTAQTMIDIRDDLAHMVVTCIPSQDILEALTTNFISHHSMKPFVHDQILEAAAHYSHAMLQGNKDLIFLETFVQTVACILKRG